MEKISEKERQKAAKRLIKRMRKGFKPETKILIKSKHEIYYRGIIKS